MSSLEARARHERMQAAFDLYDLAVAMRREALARAHPKESWQQVDERLRAWMLEPEPVPRRLVDRARFA